MPKKAACSHFAPKCRVDWQQLWVLVGSSSACWVGPVGDDIVVAVSDCVELLLFSSLVIFPLMSYVWSHLRCPPRKVCQPLAQLWFRGSTANMKNLTHLSLCLSPYTFPRKKFLSAVFNQQRGSKCPGLVLSRPWKRRQSWPVSGRKAEQSTMVPTSGTGPVLEQGPGPTHKLCWLFIFF